MCDKFFVTDVSTRNFKFSNSCAKNRQKSMEPNAAMFLMETESAAALNSALSTNYKRRLKNIVNSLTQKHWILKNITFPFTTTNLQYICGMSFLFISLMTIALFAI